MVGLIQIQMSPGEGLGVLLDSIHNSWCELHLNRYLWLVMGAVMLLENLSNNEQCWLEGGIVSLGNWDFSPLHERQS